MLDSAGPLHAGLNFMGQSQFEDEVLGSLQAGNQASDAAPAPSQAEPSAPPAMPSQVLLDGCTADPRTTAAIHLWMRCYQSLQRLASRVDSSPKVAMHIVAVS